MSATLTERVLEAWERGAGLDVNAQADLVLDLVGLPADCEDDAFLYRRDRALIDLRTTLFGAWIDGVVQCPACNTEFEMPLDLDLLRDAVPSPEPVRIEIDGYSALVRPPRSADLRGLRADSPSAGEHLFARCVIEARRGMEDVSAAALPPAIRFAAAAQLSARGMESPSLDLTCGECTHAWRAPLDIARALLGEIDGWVGRLLDDVHRIAAAYHWSEREIMALPIRRRLFYLQAIG